MKIQTLLLVSLFLSPALARADLVYKCKSVDSGAGLVANLRFDENGKAGHLELDYWNGYPPLSLVDADLKAPKAKGAYHLSFLTTLDTFTGRKAELLVPKEFIDQDNFRAMIVQTMRDKSQSADEFDCNRF